MPLTAGTRLGAYEIVGALGSGGMGEVYRAHDPRLDRDVAIKVLPEGVSTSRDRLARFEREARAVAALSHPNIVVLHSIEEDSGTRFLTMELIEGRNLASLVTPGGLPLDQVLDLVIPLADALVAAHEKGIVHRDLKPANVMVGRDGRIKVLDFGLAKLKAGPESSGTHAPTRDMQISTGGEPLGTASYMAPEQVRGHEVDARADLFSFGVLVFELASGRRPFAGRSPVDVTAAILRDEPPSLGSVRGDLPAELEHIVGRCLEKEPRVRFQTALDVLNELRALRRSIERGSAPTPRARSENVASIAVLPFVNRSASVEDEYFSDGLADELLNVLAKIRGLRVAARSSAFHFKGKDATIAQIGQALHVATILEGSVRKSGHRVRISVQLVKVADGYHLWSETYDRKLDDIFAVQDDIAQSVVKELRATLLGEEPDSRASGEVKAEVSNAARGRGTSAQALALYLLARHHTERRTREDTALSIECLEQALELDPDFALAWAELGWVHSREAGSGWAPAARAHAQAREAVLRALELQPDLGEAHSVLAWIQMTYDWDWRGAEVSLAKALESSPGNAEVLRRVGVLATYQNRLEDAIDLYRRALDHDPFSASTYNNLGRVLHAANRHIESEAAFLKALELAPDRTSTRSLFALTLIAQNREEAALAEALREPQEGFRLWALAIIQHLRRHAGESTAALDEIVRKYGDVAAFQIAEVHGMRDESDAAFVWLERAYAQRDGGLAYMRASPFLRSLHGDPRWEVLLEKMELAK